MFGGRNDTTQAQSTSQTTMESMFGKPGGLTFGYSLPAWVLPAGFAMAVLYLLKRRK